MPAHAWPHWIAVAARMGYAARGVVYLVLGTLTFLAAFRAASHTGSKGAVRTLLEQPFGSVLVGLLVVGLAGYVFWRLIQAIFDPDGLGNGVKGIFIRLALLVSAFSYSTLALYAASLLFSVRLSGGGEEGGSGKAVVSALNGIFSLDTLNLALAAIFAGVAIAHWWKAFAGTYEKYFKADESKMQIIRKVSIVGLSARGLIFATLSWLLVLRFFDLQGEDSEGPNPGLKDALSYFQDLPYGAGILAGVGLGLGAFALYSLAEARWRRIETPDFGS
ncbi:DUF1206 domain-containing protein [Roseibium aestuarii]|uniref:DUF1206 domain-containing protein n=1 Tax=Roseibium aestuarii TaxID=2600299 RepID=A0ABW4K0C6_9HYPH|nr:DUF1206 domain-containing protein [Roseibium aestuarii]